MCASPLKGLNDEEWSITSFSATCVDCGRSSEPGDTFYSVLAPGDEQQERTEEEEQKQEEEQDPTDGEDEEEASEQEDENTEENEQNGLARYDYCSSCWSPPDRHVYSFWKTNVPEPEEDEDHGPDRSTLAGIWNGILEEANRSDGEGETEQSDRRSRLLYLVTLMLMRKGYLALEEEREVNGQTVFIVRERGTDDRMEEIPEPEMTEEDLENVKEDLAELFETDEEEEGT